MATKPKALAPASGKAQNVVERAIGAVGGSPSELARRLSEYAGFPIARQRVHGWRMRGIFPRDMVVHVERLCGIPIHELASAPVKDRDEGNVVARAIRYLGADANPATLAEQLSASSGRRVTRQMVNNWLATEQFPADMALYVHVITKIPVAHLIPSRGRKWGH